MSSDPGLMAVPSGPPWSIDVLADLQAGVYPDDVSARLRAQIAGDARATAILAALDTTVDDLSLLPAPRMPERFALRLDAAIAAESSARAVGAAPGAVPGGAAQGGAVQGTRRLIPPGYGPPAFRPSDNNSPARPESSPFQQLTSTPPPGAVPTQFHPHDQAPPVDRSGQRFDGPGVPGQASGGPHLMQPGHAGDVVSLDAARARRRRWIGGLGVAAAVVVGATITLTSLNHSGGESSQAVPQPGATAPATTTAGSPNALELVPGRFQEAFRQINGAQDGPLTNALVAAACFGANDIAGPDVLGVTEVTFQGQQASAIAVKISATAARVVVVGLSCGVNGAKAALDAETVTR